MAYDPEQDRHPIGDPRVRSPLVIAIRGLQIALAVAVAIWAPPQGYLFAAVVIPYALWSLSKEMRKP